MGINYYIKHVYGAREHKLSYGWMLHEILVALDSSSKQLLHDTGITFFPFIFDISFIFYYYFFDIK